MPNRLAGDLGRKLSRDVQYARSVPREGTPASADGADAATGAELDALVEVTDVSLADPDERLAGRSLDAPVADASGRSAVGATYALEVEGWVIGRRHEVDEVQLVQDEAPIWEGHVDLPRPDVAAQHPDAPGSERGGFRATVGALSLPPNFDLRVHATLAAGKRGRPRIELGAIRGRRRPLRLTGEPPIAPLIVTTLGRTGSNMLLQLLGAHPEIVTYRPFQFETKITTYWIDVLRELAEPGSYARQLAHTGAHRRGWWQASEPPPPGAVPDEDLVEWMGATAVDELAALSRGRIDAVFGRLAAHAGRAHASYVAEKAAPGPVPSLVRELYPHARELILVRDFRDMVCSIFAFNEKWDVHGFGSERYASAEDQIRGIGRIGPRLLGALRARGDSALLVRYEDLVLEPAGELRRVLAYLGLDGGRATVAAMLETLEGAPYARDHGTADDPRSSIGRWRRELDDDLLRTCEEVFGPALQAFGYAETPA